MSKDLYMCVSDFQGGTFGMYRAETIEEWRQTALGWCDSDDNNELYKQIKKLPEKYVIDYINDIWQIEIVKITEDQKDDIIKYLVDKSDDFSYYRTLLVEAIHNLSKDEEYYDEKFAALEQFKEFINTVDYKLYTGGIND